jgi:hypothetical protein
MSTVIDDAAYQAPATRLIVSADSCRHVEAIDVVDHVYGVPPVFVTLA